MKNLKIATAKFEHKSGDKLQKLKTIEQLSAKAAAEGANIVVFHECSITGYSFVMDFTYGEMLDISELIPDGPSVNAVIAIAHET